MKKLTLIGATLIGLYSCGNDGVKEATVLTTEIDSVSYSIGISMATNIQRDFPEGNKEAIIQGLRDVLDSATLVIANEDVPSILDPFFAKKQEEARNKQFGAAKEIGIQFLEANKLQPGIQITSSGLQYLVMEEGKGNSPSITSNVLVHYHGTTPDGLVFDSSVERGEPIALNLNQVIPGWTEGLQLMKEGAKYKFFIPQELAYGANAPQGGQGPIKPFMPLVFEVELIKINS